MHKAHADSQNVYSYKYSPYFNWHISTRNGDRFKNVNAFLVNFVGPMHVRGRRGYFFLDYCRM